MHKGLGLLLLLAGCEQEPVEVRETNNPGVKVSTLFTHEGCTVYRFTDGRSHYYVRCDGAYRTASVMGGYLVPYPCGKSTCYRKEFETIPTVMTR